MKKLFALLMTVTILAGSVGMTASAGVDPYKCIHSDHDSLEITCGTENRSYTHQAWVATKPNGDPILVPCTVTYTVQKYKTICLNCGYALKTREENISFTHSIKH